ncbi:MAG TPA: hypothetical protein VF170_05890 [Planctomycetaceae bacterium]
MRLLSAALAVLSLTGCMCRPGVIDCTTNRAYPGFCKPLCGGPCDPFMWLAGDCSTCCCCAYRCGYTPYGGRTICGEDMVYNPSCVAPPLRWAAPAMPAPPTGHVVYPPGPPMPRPAVPPAPPAATSKSTAPATPPAAPPSESTRPEEYEEEPFQLPMPMADPELEPEARTGPRNRKRREWPCKERREPTHAPHP